MAPNFVRRHPLLYNWLPLVAWLGFIFFLSGRADFPQPKAHWLDLLLGIGAHMLLVGVLAILWVRALGERPLAALAAFVLTAVYGFIDEYHQSFVPGRMSDPWDLLWDGLGAALALGLWAWWRRS